MDLNTSVLIVGGSLNGLTTALLLAHRGVRCIVVERHARTSIQYKFRGISARSMEIADATVAQALARLQAWFKDPSRKLPPPEPIVDDNAVIFGYGYPNGAFVAEDDRDGGRFEDPRKPSARPGSRAPHIVVQHAGDRVSTIDLFATQWVLAYGPKGQLWPELLNCSKAASLLGVDVRGLEPAGDLRDVDGGALAAYGIDADGALLIRPDGFVAWRRRNAGGAAQADLDAAFDHVLSLGRESTSERETKVGARRGSGDR